MATTIDTKVAELRFDNKNFAENVAETMVLLQKLQDSLQFQDAGRGFTSLERAANSVQLTGLQNSISTVEKRFSAFGIAGARVIWDLTGLVEKKLGGALKNLWSNTIGQAQSGGMRRALNIKQADFQMRGLLKDAKDMEAQVAQMGKDIDKAVKGTAYSYDAAAKVGAQLLASQVKPGNDMAKALRAVSGLAAMTNTSYEEMGNIMTDIAGAGKLTNEMLTRFSYRGMNATAALGKQLGKTEAEIKEMVKKGKIDFQTFANAMDDAFGEHATEANKTYTGALDNMKAALSRIGAVYYDSHLDVMRDIFNALRVAINAVNVAITPFIQKVNALERVIADAFIKRINQFTEWLENTEWVKNLKDAKKQTEETAKAISEFDDVVKKVIHGDFGNGKVRVDKLTAASYDYATVQALVNKELYGYDKAVKDLTDDEIKKIAYDDAQYQALMKLRDAEKQVKKESGQQPAKPPAVRMFENLTQAAANFVVGFKQVGQAFEDAFKDTFNFTEIGNGVIDILEIISDLLLNASEHFRGGQKTTERWYEIFKLIFNSVKDTVGFVVKALSVVIPPLARGVFNIVSLIFKLATNLAKSMNNIRIAVGRIGGALKKNFLDPLTNFATKKLQPVIDFFKNIWDSIMNGLDAGFDKDFISTEWIDGAVEKIDKFGAWVRDIPNKVKGVLNKLPLDKIKGFFDDVYNHPLVQKLVGWMDDLGKRVGDFVQGLDDVPLSFELFNGLTKNGEKYMTSFKDAIGKAKDKLEELKEKFLALGFLDKFKTTLELIKGRLECLWQTVRPFFKEKIPSGITTIVNKFKEWYGYLKNTKPVDFFVKSFKSIFEGFTSGRYLNDFLDDLLAVKDLITSIFTGDNKTGVGLGAGMLQLDSNDKSFAAAGKKIEELTQPIRDALGNIFGDPKELYKKSTESVKSLLQGITDAFDLKNYNPKTAKNIIAAGLFILAVIKIYQKITALLDNKNAIEKVMESISGVFDSVSEYIDAKSMNVTAKSMWQVAKSFALIVAAILAIGYLDADQLGTAVGAIFVVLLALSLFAFAMSKLETALGKRDEAKQQQDALKQANENMKKNTELLKSLATGFKEVAKALVDGLAKAAQQLAKGIAHSLLIVAIVFALANMAEIIDSLSKVKWNTAEVNATLGWMAIIILSLLGVCKIMDLGKNHASIGDALIFISVAYALQMIGDAVIELAKHVNDKGFDKAMKVLRAFMVFTVVLALVMKNASYTTKESKFAMQSKGGPFVALAVAVVAMAGALYIIGHALKVISAIPEDGFEKAKGIFGLFGGLLIVILALAKDWKVGKGGASGGAATLLGLGVMAVLMAVAINMLVPALTALTIVAKFAPGPLILAASIIGILMIIMGIMSGLAAGGTGMLKAAASLVIAAYAVKVLTNALIILASTAQAGGLWSAIGALAAVLVVLGLAVAGLTVVMNSGFAPALWAGVAALVAISAACWLIGNGLYYFNKALLLAGSALPVFGQGLVNLAKIILENAPTIIGAVFTVIAGVAMAIIMSSNIVAAAVVTLIIAVATAAIFALSQISTETIQQAGEMLGSGIVKLFVFLWSAIWSALCTLCDWLYTNGPTFFFQQLPKLLGGLATIALYVVQFVVDIFGGLIGWVWDRIEQFIFGKDTDHFGDILAGIGGWFDGIRGWLKKIMGKADEDIKEPKQPLGDPDDITKNANEIAGAYEDGAGTIMAAQESSRDLIHGKTFAPLGGEGEMQLFPFLNPDQIRQEGEEDASAVDDAKTSVVGALNGFLGGEGDGFAGFKIGDQGIDFGEGAGNNVLTGVYNSLSGGQELVQGNVIGLFAGEDTVGKLKEMGVEITGDGMVEGVESAFNNADISSFGNWTKDLVNYANGYLMINSPSKVTEQTGSSMMEGLEVGMKGRAETTKGVFADSLSGVLDGLNGIMDGLGGRAAAALNGFKSAISTGMSDAKTSISSFNTAATTAFTTLPDTFGQKAESAGSRFKKGLEDAKKGAGNAAQSIANAVTGKVGLYNKMYNLGVSAVQGFVNGIRSRIQAAANAAADMADRSSESARSHLDVNSPSKVFRALGYSVGEGYIQGIQRMIPAAEKATGEMADDTLNGMQKALVAVDNLLSSNLDYTPTITPVLDLETMRSGLGTLNTMVARNSALSMLTGSDMRNSKWTMERSINNGLNAMIAGSSNADVVEAINSLKADNAELRATIASMRVVMNNRFVGQIDTSLGRQQKLVNRG